MYLSHYRLSRMPFQISTDPAFLWLGENHREALAVLRYGIMDNKGFLLLTGDVGTGKTTLLKALLRLLREDTIVATVQDPDLERLDFFNLISYSFGMKKYFKSKTAFLIHFSGFLHQQYRQGKRVLLIVDEAQRAPQPLLEEIRLLSNIELDSSKLLNIFFVGQSEFSNTLLQPENRALRQRITVNYNIAPLTTGETENYIRHRLMVAGGGEEIFSQEAQREIFLFSKGYPRLINIICDRAMLSSFAEGKNKVTAADVRECAAELRIAEFIPASTGGTPEAQTSSPPPSQQGKIFRLPSKGKMALGLLSALLFFLLSSMVYLGFSKQSEAHRTGQPAEPVAHTAISRPSAMPVPSPDENSPLPHAEAPLPRLTH